MTPLLSRNSSLSIPRPGALSNLAIIGAFVVAALLVGAVVGFGQPVLIVLLLGAVGGVALLNALPAVIWIILIGVLLISGPVTMFVPALEKGGWLFSVLGFYLIAAAILYATVGRERFEHSAPAFVSLSILFLIYGLVSIAYSDDSLMAGVKAGKRYFQFYGLLLALAVIPLSSRHIRRWWHFLVLLACLQLPLALYQRVALAPMREGMPRVDPLDIVVGTLEGSLTGGGSNGPLALFLIAMLVFLLCAWRDRVMPRQRILLLAALTTIPLVLGEVMLIVILIPLALLAAYIDLVRRNPLRFFAALMLATIFLAGLGWAFLMLNAEPGESVSSIIDSNIAYNFGQTGYYGGVSLNRTSVYPYWFTHQNLADPVSFVFGHGLGSSFGGINADEVGHMDLAHPGMFIGLTTLASILWDLGVLGAVLICAMHISVIRCAMRLARDAEPGFDRAFCRTLLALALMTAVMLLYSDAPIAVPSQEVFAALTFGLIAWRWRRGEPIRSSADTAEEVTATPPRAWSRPTA